MALSGDLTLLPPIVIVILLESFFLQGAPFLSVGTPFTIAVVLSFLHSSKQALCVIWDGSGWRLSPRIMSCVWFGLSFPVHDYLLSSPCDVTRRPTGVWLPPFITMWCYEKTHGGMITSFHHHVMLREDPRRYDYLLSSLCHVMSRPTGVFLPPFFTMWSYEKTHGGLITSFHHHVMLQEDPRGFHYTNSVMRLLIFLNDLVFN